MSSIFCEDPERCPANPDGLSLEDERHRSRRVCALCLMTLMARGVRSLARCLAMCCWFFAYSKRRQPAAIAIMLTCGGVDETPTCAFTNSSTVRTSQVPQGCSHLVVRVSARSSDAGLQVEKKTLKDCNSLVMTESFHHGRAEFECASHWRLKGPDVVPCLEMRGDVDLRWCYEGVRETVTRG